MHIHTLKLYSAIKKDKIMSFSWKKMVLGMIILNKSVSQRQVSHFSPYKESGGGERHESKRGIIGYVEGEKGEENKKRK
jgi:acyl-CoA reductase-like NAD-dependent aldehyde dehydrogenase